MLVPHGKSANKPRCPNRGYMKVKAGKFGGNDLEFYLHQLLCYMYHGPPPAHLGPHPVVHHKCHHKLCILPWHMEWVTQGGNVEAGREHKRRRDWAPLVD
jgi:hypothetical protein